jgi:probable phosphoglycerate mutase
MIYLIRHGETEWTLSGQHTGTTDLPLTEHGKSQATHLRGQSFSHVFCSPRLRAKQTCELAGYTATTEPLLAEWDYGAYEGKTHAEIAKRDPTWNIFNCGAPGGESPEQVHKRAKRLLSQLASLKGPIALFSHGHFLRALTATWLQLPIKAGALFFLSPASLSLLSFEREQPVLALWNKVDIKSHGL